MNSCNPSRSYGESVLIPDSSMTPQLGYVYRLKQARYQDEESRLKGYMTQEYQWRVGHSDNVGTKYHHSHGCAKSELSCLSSPCMQQGGVCVCERKSGK